MNDQQQLSMLHRAIKMWGLPHQCWIYKGNYQFDIRLFIVDNKCYDTAKNLIRFLLDSEDVSAIDWIVFAHPESNTDMVRKICGDPDIIIANEA